MKTIIQTIIAMCILIVPAMSQIQAGTSIQITITGVPPEEKAKFDGPYSVYDSGKIHLPLLSTPIQATGMSPESLAVLIQDAYKKAEIYTNPTVQVVSTVEGSGVKEELVHVGGQVRRPGAVKYNSNLTLYQAIQQAGGATEFGSLKRVTLFRAGKAKKYDVTDPQFMKIQLYADDTIDVPQKDWLGN